MALSMIATKRAAPLANLLRKLALKEASSVQATRLFNTNAMPEADASDDESTLNRRSDSRVSRNGNRDDDLPFFSGVFDSLTSKVGAPAASSPALPPGWHVKEDENTLQVRVDMPGLGKEHVKVSAEQNTLIIQGQEEKENEDGDENGVRRYSSKIAFPDGYYKMNEIKAEMKNGVLKIVVHKVKVEERKEVFDPVGAPDALSPALPRGWHATEDEHNLQLRVDMPGLGKEHVKVSAEQNTLIIQGQGEKENEDEDSGRRYSSRIELPDGYKMNEIKAEMKNGVLKIVVPRVKEEERKEVFQVNIE